MLLTCLLLILPFLPLHFYFLLFSPFMSHMPLRRWTINFMPRFTKRIVSQKKEKKLKWKSIFGIVYVAFYVHIAFLSQQLTRHSWAHSAFKISSKEIDRKMTAFPPTLFFEGLKFHLEAPSMTRTFTSTADNRKLSSSITTFWRSNFGNSIRPPRVKFYDWSLMLWIT